MDVDQADESPPWEPAYRAAWRLLLALAGSLLLFMTAAGGLYLIVQQANDISSYRHQMNAGIYETQAYFSKRDWLLAGLVNATLPCMPPCADKLTPESNYNELIQQIPLLHMDTSAAGQIAAWTLRLSSRDKAQLREDGSNLLYVPAAPYSKEQRIYGASNTTPLSASVLQQLRNNGNRGGSIWINNSQRQYDRFYIFRQIDKSSPEAGWLGLELHNLQVRAVLGKHGVQYLLLNDAGIPVLDNGSGARLAQAITSFPSGDFFALDWQYGLPDNILLSKTLGESGWRLIYGLPFSQLLKERYPQAALILVLLALTAAALWGMAIHINRNVITPFRQQHKALVESDAFRRALIETAPVALRVLRREDGEVVMDNQLAQQWLDQETICLTTEPINWRDKVLAATEAGNYETYVASENRLLHLAYTPTRYRGAEVVLCAFSDISVRKQQEDVLAREKQAADDANAAKTNFLATMSHEIRTPLYGALGTLELLSLTDMDQAQKQYLQTIIKSSNALLQVISDVLDVSKIEAGQLELVPVDFSPVELAQDVLRNYVAAAQRQRITIYTCVDPALPLYMRGDATRIRQILNNLLNNAVKFTDHGAIVLRVKAEQRNDQSLCVTWQVSDTGMGIPMEKQAGLFKPFFQVDGHTHTEPGTGLGLSICSSLINLMNGQIRVVSEPGLGSSFSATLPLEISTMAQPAAPTALASAPVYVRCESIERSDNICSWLRLWGAQAHHYRGEADADRYDAILLDYTSDDAPRSRWQGRVVFACELGGDQPEPLPHAHGWRVNAHHLHAIGHAIALAQQALPGAFESMSPQHGGQSNEPALGLRILVAEDNPINQLLLREQLERLACQVEVASDGKEALRHWHAGTFDLILTDINMPGMSGYELSRSLQAAGNTAPIYGLTANATPEEKQRCLAAGMSDCLIKPITLKGLYQLLSPLSLNRPA